MIKDGRLWIVNSSLVIFLFIVVVYLILSFTPNISFKSLYSNSNVQFNVEKDDEIKAPSYEKIFERDVFNIVPSIPEEEQRPLFVPEKIIKVEEPPIVPKEVFYDSNEKKQRNFLPPLQLVVRGTIINSDPKYNRAFIENSRTKDERSYGLGDIVDDAQIIFIGKQKIVFIRSNGQQETIYISKSAAEKDNAIFDLSWNSFINKDKNNNIRVDVGLIVKRVETLGNFLDELDVVTYFNNSIPVGCIVCSSDENSLSNALGLKVNDVIVSVDGIRTNTPESRVKIYENLILQSYEVPVTLSVKVLRSDLEIEINYILFEASVDEYKRNLGILSFGENKRFVKDRDAEQKEIVEEQIKKGHDTRGNISKDILEIEKELPKKAGKKNALYRL
jgi:hypothetical protein